MDILAALAAIPSITDAFEMMDASNKSLAAIDANRAGQYDKAIRLHTEALEARLRVHGERSIISAISFNNLGEALLATGRLGAAAGAFAKALVVMEYQEFGGMELGSRVSAATSRDNMARVLEARGDFPGAREMRLKGAAKGHTKCGCEDCAVPGGAMLSRSELKACGACRSVFYCSPECQKIDWTKRHRPLCKQYMASNQAAANSSAGAGTSA